MRHPQTVPIALLAGVLAFAAIGLAGRKPPSVDSVEEARDPVTNAPMVVLKGKKWRKVRGAELFDAQGASLGTLGGVVGRNGASFRLPPGIAAGDYDLVITHGRRGDTFTIRTTLELGTVPEGAVSRGTLAPVLADDLDDAGRVDGQLSTFFRDATNLDAGTLPGSRFQAFDDLRAESQVDEDGQLSTDTFDALRDLAAEGILDGNDRLEQSRFSAAADLQAEGHLDQQGNLPATEFSAAANLGARGKIGGGSSMIAPGDHDHDDDHLSISGGELAGGLTVDTASDSVPALKITEVADAVSLVTLENKTTGEGITFQATQASETSMNPTPIIGEHQGVASGYNIGVLGISDSPAGTGCIGESVVRGVFATGNASDELGMMAQQMTGGTALEVDVTVDDGSEGKAAVHVAGRAGDILEMEDSVGTVMRIDHDGQGLFNGGIATSGADIAESVAVADDAADYGPGDVLVIDRSAARTFGLATSARSRLVAGVVSTKPALVGSVHDVATLGLPGDEVVLGIAGIVPTKVSAENGAIRAGDLLVTASVPGHAMRAGDDPAPGTVLGKALGDLDEGTGVVEVLLSMK